jgi:ATP-dependent DNA helicase RecG
MAYAALRQEVEAGRQAYVVVPKVEEGEDPALKSVEKHMKQLAAGPLSGLRLAMLHGQMRPEEKQAVMAQMREGEVDVLVATTVVEVGVDVPNANVMLIENAERFGLSQLHQLRGRVGRGKWASWCLLVGDTTTEEGQQRLESLVRMADGFEIAEADLRLRGPGEFFGTRQHGLPEFKLADIAGELEMLKTTREDVLRLLESDPQLRWPAHQALRDRLVEQFGDTLELAQVG